MVQLSLKKSTLDLNRALEQMTTGYRINSAKDDAAGYAVATRMGINLSSYRVAQNNANLGLSLLNTAESSLDIVTTHLQRIRDLAEQAANGTYGQDSIDAIQAEIDARTEEINRIMSTTEYNGIKLFDGGGTATNAVTRLASSARVGVSTQSLPSATGYFIKEIQQLSEEEAIAQGYTIIKTADDLDNIRNNPSGKYILMNDIDMSSFGNWTPIGDDSKGYFTGELNGNGYVVKNLTVNNSSFADAAFFESISTGAVVKNFGLENVDISTSGTKAAGLSIGCAGTVSNCFVTGKVSAAAGGNFVGGFIANVGVSASVITDCYSSVDVSGVSMIGGFVGVCAGTISNCYSTGTVTSTNSGPSQIGGFLGDASLGQKISNCYTTSSVIFSGPSLNAGGFAGCLSGMYGGGITDCYYNTDTSGISKSYGGTGVTTDELNQLINGTLPQAKPPDQVVIPPANSGGGGNPGGGTGGGGNTGDGNITLQIGIDSSENSRLSFNTALSINLNIDVSTTANAINALDEIDAVIDQITAKQTEFGAVQNRLDSIIDSLDVSIENTTSSLSTIKDADIAKVSSDFIRAQILQQASAALLATANQSPSFALNLI